MEGAKQHSEKKKDRVLPSRLERRSTMCAEQVDGCWASQQRRDQKEELIILPNNCFQRQFDIRWWDTVVFYVRTYALDALKARFATVGGSFPKWECRGNTSQANGNRHAFQMWAFASLLRTKRITLKPKFKVKFFFKYFICGYASWKYVVHVGFRKCFHFITTCCVGVYFRIQTNGVI